MSDQAAQLKGVLTAIAERIHTSFSYDPYPELRAATQKHGLPNGTEHTVTRGGDYAEVRLHCGDQVFVGRCPDLGN